MTPFLNVRFVLPAPQWLVIAMLGFVILAALMRIGIDLYVVNVKTEDFDRTRDDADKGVRGVERHDAELAELREEVTAAMLDHAERLDALEDPPADTEPVRIPTVEAAAAIDQWHALTTRRPVPYRRGDR